MYARPDEAIAEKVYAAEKDAALVRIAVIALNTVVFAFLLSWEHVIPWMAISLLSLAWVYGLFVHFVKPYRRFPILLSSYFTSLTDAVLITLWLHATGGFDSQFYVLWYVSIAAIAYRWNNRDTLIACGIYGLSYVGLLAAHGQLDGHYAEITLRVGYIFLVGALGMLLSGEMMEQIKTKVQLRQVVAQAAAAEAKFRGLLDSAPDPIIIANQDGRIVIVNAEVERTFGYSRNEIVGQSVEIIIPPEFRGDHTERWAQYSANPKQREVSSITARVRGLHKDGTEFPVDIRLSPTQTKEGLLVTAVIRDMSERQAIQAALEDSEERFRRLSEVTVEGVVIHENGIILDVNRSLTAMFGYETEEMVGQPAVTFLAPESRPLALASLQEPPGRTRRYDAVRHDGSSFPIEAQAREYRLDGRLVRVSVVRDITEQLKAEAALQESEARFRALIEKRVRLDHRYRGRGPDPLRQPLCPQDGLQRKRPGGPHLLRLHSPGGYSPDPQHLPGKNNGSWGRNPDRVPDATR